MWWVEVPEDAENNVVVDCSHKYSCMKGMEKKLLWFFLDGLRIDVGKGFVGKGNSYILTGIDF